MFLPQRPVTDALLMYTLLMEDAHDRKQEIHISNNDCTQAYDAVPPWTCFVTWIPTESAASSKDDRHGIVVTRIAVQPHALISHHDTPSPVRPRPRAKKFWPFSDRNVIKCPERHPLLDALDDVDDARPRVPPPRRARTRAIPRAGSRRPPRVTGILSGGRRRGARRRRRDWG